MSVYKMKDKARDLPWRAVISRKHQPPLRKHFATREEAQMWESYHRKAERLRDVPEFRAAADLQKFAKVSVKDLVEDFIIDHPAMNRNDVISLRRFATEEVASKSLVEFSKQDVYRWIEKRQRDTWKPPGSKVKGRPLTPRTIRREANIVQRVFQSAIEHRDGYASLPNHFRGVRIVGSTGGRRERSLEDGELERILQACASCHEPNKYFVPLAIHLAIDTGMRRQEIFNLMWSDIDEPNRRIRIRKSKTDKATGNVGATIVLPAKARSLLITLVVSLIHIGREVLPEKQWQEICKSDGNDFKNGWPVPNEWPFPSCDERIFPMREQSFSQVWADVLRRAGIRDLHFHDLRREANTRFIKAGLTVEERNIMLRHADKSMNSVYVGRNALLKEITDKLDRYVLNGLTLAEAEARGMIIEFGELTVPIRGKPDTHITT
jgi:integrase